MSDISQEKKAVCKLCGDKPIDKLSIVFSAENGKGKSELYRSIPVNSRTVCPKCLVKNMNIAKTLEKVIMAIFNSIGDKDNG